MTFLNFILMKFSKNVPSLQAMSKIFELLLRLKPLYNLFRVSFKMFS